MLALLVAFLAGAAEPAAAPYVGWVADGGVASDGGVQDQVIDRSGADAGIREEAVISRFPVRIQGLKMLPAEVILDVLRLPPHATPSESTAAILRKQVLNFLIRTGFELARVQAHVREDGIVVEVDEGQFERIVFVGQLSYQLLRFKLSLKMPNNVFSRPVLERQIRELSESLNVPDVRWELVRSSEVIHTGPQLGLRAGEVDDSIQGDLVVHARKPYEVRIYFPSNTLGSTLGIDLRSGFTNGLEVGVNLPGGPVLGREDGWLAEASVGLGLRSKIGTEKIYAHFSRSYLGLRYHTGPIIAGLRTYATLESELVARQRADVNLENYNALTTTGGLHLEWEIRKGLQFLLGYGFEWRRLFGFELPPGDALPTGVGFIDRKRPFVRWTHESVMNPTVLRWDRRHTLMSEVRQYFSYRGESGNGWADLRYQYVKEYGWNDLWVKSRGHLSWGKTIFHDDTSTGEYLHGLFGALFVPSALNLQLEYRLSLVRDIFKLSLFHDLALIAERTGVNRRVAPRLANGFGPGVHFLFQDLFQIDSYLAFGFRGKAVLDFGFSLQIQKVF